jgi:hypothetical protein
MKTILSAVVLSAVLAGAAYAGSSQGSGARLPIGVEGTSKVEHSGQIYRVPAPVKRDPNFVPLGEGVVPQSGWNPFGTVALSKDELARQQADNREWSQSQYGTFVRSGGCNADFLGHFAAAWCWNRLGSGAPYVTGSPQVGTGWGGGSE